MSNKTLNASVKLDTKSAVSSLTRLEKKIKAVNTAINKTSTGNNKLTTQINKAVTATNKLNTATQKVVTTTNKVNSANIKASNSARKIGAGYASSNSAASRLLGTVKSIAATYFGIMGARAVINTSDTITSAENRLNNLPGGNAQLTQESMDNMYAAAQRSRSGYGDMMSNVSKTMTLAGDAFQNNIDNAIRFQEIMAKSYTIGGASAAEQASSMYQLVQALGSGVLQGDELRSVREGAPLAYKAIEEFAQGVYNTDESLKDLASQGKITSDLVVAAIMNAEDQINKSFENTQMTFAQAWTSIKNMAIKAFEPVLQMLNDALNSDAGRAIIDGIGKAFVILANIILWVGDVLGRFFNWCYQNWEWLKYVILGVLIVIGAMFAITAAQAIWSALTAAWAWLQAYWPLLLIVAGIMGILYVYELWRQGTIDTVEFICAALMIVAIVFVIVAAICTAGIYLIIAAVLAAVALALLYFEYVAGGVMWLGAVIVDIILIVYNILMFVSNLIVGIIAWCLTMIYNMIIGVINGIIQLIWWAVEPFIGIVEYILNTCNGGFNSFGDAVANLIGQIISWFLSLGKVVTTIIDSIFGTDWTSGLNSLQESVLAWGKNEDAITLSREAPTLDRLDATDSFMSGMDTFSYATLVNPMDAYETGYNWGAGIKESLNDWGSQFQNENITNGIFSDLGNLTGLTSGGLLNPNDPAYSLNGNYDPDDFLKNIDNIDSNVGDIKDSMDLSNDDLEYLRKIADMEWRNEFTTAEIRIDMTNNNTVNSDRDLDGIVDYLSDVLRNEMTNVAYGVHY